MLICSAHVYTICVCSPSLTDGECPCVRISAVYASEWCVYNNNPVHSFGLEGKSHLTNRERTEAVAVAVQFELFQLSTDLCLHAEYLIYSSRVNLRRYFE